MIPPWEKLTVDGLIDTNGPFARKGVTDALRVTFPLNPPDGKRSISVVSFCPAISLSELGERLRLKSGGGGRTVTDNEMSCANVPPNP